MNRLVMCLALVPILAACDMGTYTPGQRHGGDSAMTGSRLEGVDTGSGSDTSDPSLRQVRSGAGGGR